MLQITLMLIHWGNYQSDLKTATRQKPPDDDEFNDIELGEDLLPE